MSCPLIPWPVIEKGSLSACVINRHGPEIGWCKKQALEADFWPVSIFIYVCSANTATIFATFPLYSGRPVSTSRRWLAAAHFVKISNTARSLPFGRADRKSAHCVPKAGDPNSRPTNSFLTRDCCLTEKSGQKPQSGILAVVLIS